MTTIQINHPTQVRQRGKVKFFNIIKGYGFIIFYNPPEYDKVEVFVHHTSICNDGGFKSLAEGEDVEFDLIKGPKGFQAANVSGPNGVSVKGDPNAPGRRPIYTTNNYIGLNPAYGILDRSLKFPAGNDLTANAGGYGATMGINQPYHTLQSTYATPLYQQGAHFSSHQPPYASQFANYGSTYPNINAHSSNGSVATSQSVPFNPQHTSFTPIIPQYPVSNGGVARFGSSITSAENQNSGGSLKSNERSFGSNGLNNRF
ncbi:CSD-domain-containing protein [Gigaspora margarita]|uniref:CSD-domain-containing protein n=1 Tax=Gigaspora margarita TaxID=4874 RepID=A0A8H3XGV7_GIGMA|nr:CSD-domain-containing protein [Gigaspora margarita]